jgi:histidine triad (HIT) family protein
MPITGEQAKSIKEQILKQVENFPEDKREEIKSYVHSMNNEQLEEFVIKNRLVKPAAEAAEGKEGTKKLQGSECIYCLIASKQIESFAIYEDKDYLAVLEINPFSQGHTILIPKRHIKETKSLKAKAFTIANKIGKHLIKQLKAEDFQLSSSDELKHAIINIVPIYKNQKITYERKPAKKQELQELAIKIGEVKKREKSQKAKLMPKIEESRAKSAIIQLSRRIP